MGGKNMRKMLKIVLGLIFSTLVNISLSLIIGALFINVIDVNILMSGSSTVDVTRFVVRIDRNLLDLFGNVYSAIFIVLFSCTIAIVLCAKKLKEVETEEISFDVECSKEIYCYNNKKAVVINNSKCVYLRI
jgi:hypothetical protein